MILLLLACFSSPKEVSVTEKTEVALWGAERPTQLKRYAVGVTMVPELPPMGELFEVVASVRNANGEPLENGKVTLNALMPQHGHGMETDPKMKTGNCEGAVCTFPEGKYTAEGFKFHMGGEWTVTVEVMGPLGPDSTSFVYPMPN